MNWLFGGTRGRASQLVGQLADPAQRDRAADELLRLESESVPALIEALQTRDPAVHAACRQILARIRSAQPALNQALATAPVSIREGVADLLAQRKDPASLPALVEALKDTEYSVRYRAARTLGALAHPEAVPPLTRALKDAEERVRIEACLALGGFNDPGTYDDLANLLLDDPSLVVRQTAAGVLGNTADPAVLPYLLEALHDSFWWYERETAVEVLLTAIQTLGEPAAAPLIEALQDKEGTVRRLAARVLGALKHPDAIEPLGMTLYDLHTEVSGAAAQALACFGPAGVDQLAGALRHPEMGIRVHAIQALSGIPDARVPPLLIRMLEDPEREVRLQAVRGLGKLDDVSAVPALQRAAEDRSDRELRALALQAIAELSRAR